MLVGRTPAACAEECTPKASAPPRTEDEPSTRVRLPETIVTGRQDSIALSGANLGYHVNDHVTFAAELFQILDRKDHDIDYYHSSFVTGVDPTPAPGAAPDGVADVHFKPVEPISFRLTSTIRF